MAFFAETLIPVAFKKERRHEVQVKRIPVINRPLMLVLKGEDFYNQRVEILICDSGWNHESVIKDIEQKELLYQCHFFIINWKLLDSLDFMEVL